MSPRAEGWHAPSATQYGRLADGVLINAPNAPVATPPATSTDPAPVTVTNAAQAFPSKAVMLYHLLWPNSNVNNLGNYYFPSNINCVSLAFFQGDPPSIVGYTAAGETAFLQQLRNLRASGVRIGISLGGAGGHINLANRTGVINSVMAFSNNKCPVDYLDIDLEGSASPGLEDTLSIARSLRSQRGPNFQLTMAPSGGTPVSVYRPIGKALQDEGLLAMFGQQFYDNPPSQPITQAVLDSAIQGYLNAGITQDHISIGMMVDYRGTDNWDVDTSVSRVTGAKQKWPNLRGGYLWVEKTQTAALDWANRVGNLLKA